VQYTAEGAGEVSEGVRDIQIRVGEEVVAATPAGCVAVQHIVMCLQDTVMSSVCREIKIMESSASRTTSC
jgi:hypothetical protein